MDYLLRDSLFTGVSYGKFDLSRLIKSLTLTVHKNEYYVCVLNKYISSIEEYLLSRYHMHEEVYLHSFKCEMELIVKKILYRAYELYNTKVLKNNLPSALLSVFEGKDMTVGEYISLDDNILISLIAQWRNLEDPILSTLCKCFLDRRKYEKLSILRNTDKDIEEFKRELSSILKLYGYNVTDFNTEYFWLQDKVKNKTYKATKDNIWILTKDGTLMDLLKVSKVITDRSEGEKNMTYINFDIMKKINEIKEYKKANEDITNLIKLYSNKNHIEIEKKYYINDKKIFARVCKLIKDYGIYKVIEEEDVYQEDYYYDTPEKLLHNSNKTLRVRKKKDSYSITIKTPTKDVDDKPQDQSERFEFKKSIVSDNIRANEEYIIKYLPELTEQLHELQNTLVIKNNRTKLCLSSDNVEFEMVLDDVTYSSKESVHEYQIEFELKSDFLHRVNLKKLSDYLEAKIPELEPTTDSKYNRGLILTNSL